MKPRESKKVKPRENNFELALNKILIFGILIFIILFLYASSFYPGGSQENINSVGYDWVHNYWCNLMSEWAMNGEVNQARCLAIVAMFVLTTSISIFFYQFSEFISKGLIWKNMVKIGGFISMGFAMLIFTDYHDLMTILSSVFGLVALTGIIKEIYKSPYTWYKSFGLLCLLLLGLNNVVYYTKEHIEYLPVIQKITFLIVLTWMLGINKLIKKEIIKGSKTKS